MKNHLLVFSGNSNKKLALDICKYLKMEIGDANIGIIASVFMRLFDLLWLIVFGAISSFKLSAHQNA